MRKTYVVRAILSFFIASVILVCLIMFLQKMNENSYQEKQTEMTDGFGELRKVEWNGVTYKEKPAVTIWLIAGIDKADNASNTAANTYRNGGQADFLLIVAIDHTSKQIHQLQIDRDTMTGVVTLGIFGNETGMRTMQICLSHSFGKTPQDNARYTVRAVQSLLEGIVIDGYYIISYSAIPEFNDALGGVTVHLADDMTDVNPAWTMGSTVTLHGKEAEAFVRARRNVGSGTNQERMIRHKEYMQNAIAQMNSQIRESPSFCNKLLQSLQSCAATNMSITYLETELMKAYSYEILPVDYLEGEYSIGEDGFTEFHIQSDSAVEWVIQHLYTRMDAK